MTSLHEVRRLLGEPAGPSLVLAAERLSLSEIDLVAESLVDMPRSELLTPRPATHIWPLVPLRASLFFDHLRAETAVDGYGSAGVRLSDATNPRLRGSGAFSAGVMRALLYSHGLALEDPLRHAAEMHLSQTEDVRRVSRLGISTAIASLCEIADLLDSGVVDLFFTGGDELRDAGVLGDAMVSALDADDSAYTIEAAWHEFESQFVRGLSAPLRELWSRVRSGDRAPDLGLVREAADDDDQMTERMIDLLQTLNPRSIVHNAVAAASCAVAAIQHLGGSRDVLCGSALMAKLLFLGLPDPQDQVRVHQLASLRVPNIDALATADLVAIRQTSAAMETWRTDLAAALDYAVRARDAGGSSGAIQSAVEEQLAEARDRVAREASSSRIWSSSNVVSFVAGGLGGGGGALVDGTTGALATGGSIGLLAAFATAAGKRRSVPGFLDRHYVAFATER